MKDCQNIIYKDIVLKKISPVQDNFQLKNSGGKINIINVTCKSCILSHYISKDSCGVAINVYGLVITEILFFIEREFKKCTLVFTTPFNHCIYTPDKNCKIRSVTVSINNKHINKIRECSLAAFFTLMFTIKVSCPNKNDLPQNCNEDINDFNCVDTITINCDDEIDSCENFSSIPSDLNCNSVDELENEYLVMKNKPMNPNRKPQMIENDVYKYLTSFQQNNRL